MIGCFILAGTASANPIARIVAFGDSLFDTGNHFAFGVPASPPYDQGRFADGAVWVELLAAGIGVPSPLPSRLGGTDYAWAGAETAESGMSARGTPNVGTQIAAYLDTRPTIAPESTLFVIGGAATTSSSTCRTCPTHPSPWRT